MPLRQFFTFGKSNCYDMDQLRSISEVLEILLKLPLCRCTPQNPGQNRVAQPVTLALTFPTVSHHVSSWILMHRPAHSCRYSIWPMFPYSVDMSSKSQCAECLDRLSKPEVQSRSKQLKTQNANFRV